MEFLEILSQYFTYGERVEPDPWWKSYVELGTKWLYPLLGWILFFLTGFLTRETHNGEALQNMEAQLQQISARTIKVAKGVRAIKGFAKKGLTAKGYANIKQCKAKMRKVLMPMVVQVAQQAGGAIEHSDRGFPETNQKATLQKF